MNFPELTVAKYTEDNFNVKQYVKGLDIVGAKFKKPVQFEVKIADLGFARKLECESLASTRLGTPLVMAPEVLEGNKYDHSADVWSLGCIFYEMMTGFSPFTGMSQTNLLENIAKGDYSFPKTLKFSLQGLSFLNMCLQFNHELRPSLLELSTHPYIALDEALEESSADDLFLSYHPQSKSFKPDKPLNNGIAINSIGSHEDILKNPYAWMKNNPDQVIPLNVHGNDQYDKVVMERFLKLEQAQKVQQEKAKKESMQPIQEKDEAEFEDFVDQEQQVADKLIETSFILPINSNKEFPPLPSLDQSLKESYTTANNGLDEESKQDPSLKDSPHPLLFD